MYTLQFFARRLLAFMRPPQPTVQVRRPSLLVDFLQKLNQTIPHLKPKMAADERVLVGASARTQLREGLSSHAPLDFIATFQERNGLATPASRAALPMVFFIFFFFFPASLCPPTCLLMLLFLFSAGEHSWTCWACRAVVCIRCW
jgi:hypothetical protein